MGLTVEAFMAPRHIDETKCDKCRKNKARYLVTFIWKDNPPHTSKYCLEVHCGMTIHPFFKLISKEEM